MADPISATLAASTILSATGSIMGGISENNAAKYRAGLLQQQGNQQIAASQRNAYQAGRQGDLVASRARAVAAASGAGATDAGVQDIQSQIAGQKEYNVASALYEGQDYARTANAEAGLERYQGNMAEVGGYLNAGAKLAGGFPQTTKSIISGGASLFDKYGKADYVKMGYSDLPSYG